MTQEFHLYITLVGQDEYLLWLEQVAPGVPLAQELVSWPVADWLRQAEQRKTCNGSWQSHSVTLGQQLYDAVFQGSIRESWIRAQEIAQQQQEVLRLRLGFKDTRLARLPWEAMFAGDSVSDLALPKALAQPPKADPTLAIDPRVALELDFAGEEDWEEVFDQIEYNDPAYEQDAALVSELFHQVANQSTTIEPQPLPYELSLPQENVSRTNEVCTKDAFNSPDFMQRTRETSRVVWVVSGVVGVAAIALLGVWWYQNRTQVPRSFYVPANQAGKETLHVRSNALLARFSKLYF